MSHIVDEIFAQLDAADVRLVRAGDELRARGVVPPALLATLKRHKPELLAHIPDQFGWHHGAIYGGDPRDVAALERALGVAGKRGGA